MEFKIAFVVFIVLYTLIRVPYLKSYKLSKKMVKVHAVREKIMANITAWAVFVFPLVYMFSPYQNYFEMGLPVFLKWLGFVVCSASLVLFWWAHKALNTNWSPVLEINENQKLITSGPYGYIRHPMYSIVYLFIFGVWLMLSNWLIGLVIFIAWSLVYFIRVGSEEEMMIKQFGKEYQSYMKLTPRLIPRFGS